MRWLNSTLKRTIISLVLLTPASGLYAATAYCKVIYSAFIVRDMTKWENVILSMEASNSVSTVDQKLELINYYYGYIGYLIGKKQYEPVEKLIARGERLITQVLITSPKNATAYSFKGSFLAFHVGINKYKAIFLGPESKWYVNKALELDPQNIQALLDKGNQFFYAPEMLGGDKKEALIYFLKAVNILEKRKETNENWIYLNLLTMVAFSYEKTGQHNEAKTTYEKIIRNEPKITWVKSELYPGLQAKANNK
jgi:tetratricopeptide (TPR) repeat protein